MTTIQAWVDDDTKARAESRARELGFRSASAWARSLIERELAAASVPEPTLEAFAAMDWHDDEGEELPDLSRPCLGCGKPFVPAHHNTRYCDACQVARGPQACKICGRPHARGGNPFCGMCFYSSRNCVWLFRQFLKLRLEEASEPVTPLDRVRDAFKAWARDDLNLEPNYAKLTEDWQYSRVLRESGYSSRNVVEPMPEEGYDGPTPPPEMLVCARFKD